MDYTDFKKEDFIRDEYFQQWVKAPDAGNCHFWEQFVRDNPEKESTIQEAKERIEQLSAKVPLYSFKEEMWEEIKQQISESPQGIKRLPKKHSAKKYWAMAVGFACILGLTVFGVYKYEWTVNKTPSTLQITLTLQDGSKQVMDETDSKVITTKEGHTLGNQDKHMLVYEKTQENAIELAYNELTVPYGRQFELVLSDGSHVWLNAGSTLRYPVRFLPGQARDVFLDGEAFFEVTRDKARPFTVVTGDMNTRVYGTQFNVTSYKDEGHTYTVLVEGSVGVYPKGNEPAVQKIEPGQRALFEDQAIRIEPVNIRKYTAWKGGQMYFMDDKLDLVFRKLERHFNVNINYTVPELGNQRVTSAFKNDDSLEEVLRVLQMIHPFQYSIEGRSVNIK